MSTDSNEDRKSQIEERRKQIREATAAYFNAKYRIFWNEYFMKHGHPPEQKEFADFLGIKEPSLSRWMKARGIPNDEQKKEIAKRLGPGIYTVTGSTEVLPDDNRVRSLLNDWFELTQEQQDEYLARIKEDIENNARRREVRGSV